MLFLPWLLHQPNQRKVSKKIDQSRVEFKDTFREVLSEYLGKFKFWHQACKRNLQNILKNNEITFGKPQLKSKPGSGILYANSILHHNIFKANATQWHWSKYVLTRTL